MHYVRYMHSRVKRKDEVVTFPVTTSPFYTSIIRYFKEKINLLKPGSKKFP